MAASTCYGMLYGYSLQYCERKIIPSSHELRLMGADRLQSAEINGSESPSDTRLSQLADEFKFANSHKNCSQDSALVTTTIKQYTNVVQ
jgi:hypothetical protein